MVTELEPRGDQPAAITALVAGVQQGHRQQTLLGVTGSGKTYTMAKVIEAVQRPTLVLAPTKALMERRDVVVVASVSCIFGLGRPEDYKEVMLLVRKGERRVREEILRRLVDIQYERNDIDFARGRFRVRGDVIEVHPSYEDRAVRIELFGDEVERIIELNPVSGEVLEEKSAIAIWPAKHWVTTDERLDRALR